MKKVYYRGMKFRTIQLLDRLSFLFSLITHASDYAPFLGGFKRKDRAFI